MILYLTGSPEIRANLRDKQPWTVNPKRTLLGDAQMTSLKRIVRMDYQGCPPVAVYTCVGGKKGKRILPDDTPKTLALKDKEYMWVEADSRAQPPPKQQPQQQQSSKRQPRQQQQQQQPAQLPPPAVPQSPSITIPIRDLPPPTRPQIPIQYPPLPEPLEQVPISLPPALNLSPPPEMLVPAPQIEVQTGGLSGVVGKKVMERIVKLSTEVKELRRKERAGGADNLKIQMMMEEMSKLRVEVANNSLRQRERESEQRPVERKNSTASSSASVCPIHRTRSTASSNREVCRRKGDWIEVWDPNKNATYYANELTRESRWDPEGTPFEVRPLKQKSVPQSQSASPIIEGVPTAVSVASTSMPPGDRSDMSDLVNFNDVPVPAPAPISRASSQIKTPGPQPEIFPVVPTPSISSALLDQPAPLTQTVSEVPVSRTSITTSVPPTPPSVASVIRAAEDYIKPNSRRSSYLSLASESITLLPKGKSKSEEPEEKSQSPVFEKPSAAPPKEIEIDTPPPVKVPVLREYTDMVQQKLAPPPAFSESPSRSPTREMASESVGKSRSESPAAKPPIATTGMGSSIKIPKVQSNTHTPRKGYQEDDLTELPPTAVDHDNEVLSDGDEDFFDIQSLRRLPTPPPLSPPEGPPQEVVKMLTENPDRLPLDIRQKVAQMSFHDPWFHELVYQSLRSYYYCEGRELEQSPTRQRDILMGKEVPNTGFSGLRWCDTTFGTDRPEDEVNKATANLLSELGIDPTRVLSQTISKPAHSGFAPREQQLPPTVPRTSNRSPSAANMSVLTSELCKGWDRTDLSEESSTISDL